MDIGELIKSRTVLVALVASSLFAAAVGFAVFGDGAGLSDSAPEPLTADVSGGVVPATNAPGSLSGSEGLDEASEQDSSGSGGSGPTTSDDDGQQAAGDDKVVGPDAASAQASVKVIFYNDTDKEPVSSVTISVADSSWMPDTGKDTVSGTIRMPLDAKTTLVVLPDGEQGRRIEVPVSFSSAMRADSERDAIIIEIDDAQVRVLGNPVTNVDDTFDRF